MTPHIESKKEDIAKVVLMPGDPLRAKYIAEHFLEDAVLVNQVRNMYAYTGYYHKTRVTVFPSGMGCASMGIYSYELFHFYDVDVIIRIGSAGAYQSDLNLYDLLLVKESYTASNFAESFVGVPRSLLRSDEELNQQIKQTALSLGLNLKEERVHCTDVFYSRYERLVEQAKNAACAACEMESFALFANAKVLGKKAACLLTISDNLVTKEETTSKERETAFSDMMKLALETITNL